MNEGFCNRHLPMFAVVGDSLYTDAIYEDIQGGVYRLTGKSGQWEQMASPSRLMGVNCSRWRLMAPTGHAFMQPVITRYFSPTMPASHGLRCPVLLRNPELQPCWARSQDSQPSYWSARRVAFIEAPIPVRSWKAFF